MDEETQGTQETQEEGIQDPETFFAPITLEEADLTFNEISRILRSQLRKRTMGYCYIRDITQDYVVYEDDSYDSTGAYMRRDYSISDTGLVTFGPPQEVVMLVDYVPAGDTPATSPEPEAASEAEGSQPGQRLNLQEGHLLEAVDAEGYAWRIQIIEAGISKNRTEYPLDLLHQRATLYEGAPVYVGYGPDHNPMERGVRSIGGFIRNVQPNATGLEGVLQISRGDPELRERVKEAWEVYQDTGRMPFGFSHWVSGVLVEKIHNSTIGGLVQRVKDFDFVDSVDMVVRPSAGGRLIGLMASVDDGQTEKEIHMLEALLAKVRNGEALTEAEKKQLLEEAPAEYAKALEAAAAALATEEESEPEDAEPTTVQEAQLPDNVADALRRLEQFESRGILQDVLQGSRLDRVIAESIREDFEREIAAGRSLSREQVQARVDRDRNLFARLAESHGIGLPISGTIEVTTDQRDKWQEAMDGFFGLIRGATPAEDTIDRKWFQIDGSFQGIKEAFRAITGREPRPEMIMAEAVSYLPPDYLVESITTSTFSLVLGDSIRRRMIAEYSQPSLQGYMRLVSEVSPLQDFRTNHRIRMGGYGDLPTVGQGAPYQPLTSPGNEEVTYEPSKKGGTEDLTMETLMNDDMRLVRQIPVELGRAAIRTLRHAIFVDTLANNATIYDSVALFHTASHGNLGSSALSGATLSTTRAAMRSQYPYGITNQPLGAANVPRTIFAPSELEEIALQIAASNFYVGTVDDEARTPNIHQGVTVEVVDEWTDATDWVAAANPAMVPIIELGFLGGRTDPELFVQDAQTAGSVFTADKITYKIRHIWGFAVLDYRGLYKHVVAG